VRNAAVIAADSCAVYRNQILEKPKYKMEAVEMLKQLSGRSNVFISGWVVHNTLTGKSKSGVSETRITFRELTEGEIIDYANDHDVVQWAAGYSPFNTRAISFVKKLSGSFTNFTHGLPLEEIVPILRDFDLL
jgi:septum formation protein